MSKTRGIRIVRGGSPGSFSLKVRVVSIRATVMLLCGLLVGGLTAPTAHAVTGVFVVNSANDANDGTCDSTHCSLREAITAANGFAGADSIHFSIGTGQQTINPTTILPVLAGDIVLDGTTQPGFATGPIIELNGTGVSGRGLGLSGSNNTVKGLVINRFSQAGIDILGGNNNVVRGNYIGTDITGTSDLGNSGNGVLISGGTSHIVGGSTAAERNVISGNDQNGIFISNTNTSVASTDHVVLGNFVGTNAAGSAAVQNSFTGISVGGSNAGVSGVLIGGTAPGTGNVVSGNGANGISVNGSGASTDNAVKGNYIGVGADATSDVHNNRVGFVSTGGVSVNQSGVVIGGTESGAGNVIALNHGFGVTVGSESGVSIRGNSIHSNAVVPNNSGLGIDLVPSGVTANDASDSDSGPNNLQNFPVITSGNRDSGNTTMAGTLSSTASGDFTIDFYSVTSCDPSGNGEGQTYLGSEPVTTDGAGEGSFNKLLTGEHLFVTATATAADGSTSEFSRCTPTTGTTYPLTVNKTGAGSGTVTSSPLGIDCGSDCTETYATDTVVTLTAAANSDSAFSGWSGACAGTSATCQVTMNAVKNVTANFIPRFTLTVLKTGDGDGTVTSTIAGINCGGDCSEDYPAGQVVTLNASASTGSALAGWSGACTNEAGSCQVTMSQAREVTATFITGFALNIGRTGSGSGTVTSSPAGINCGTDCYHAYAPGTIITLTATAAPPNVFTGQPSAFAGWSGACTNETGTCEVTMSQARNVTANFSQAYLLTVSRTGSGSGTVTSSPVGINCGTDCSHPYAVGASVILTATPATGSVFTGWSGACTAGGGPCQVTMSQARSVTANFAPAQVLDVTKNGTGSGTVFSSPSGVSCGNDCTQEYAEGTVVTLTANPVAGSDFSGWSGACTNATGTCMVTMSEARSVNARFTQRTHLLTVDTDGTGSGTVTSSPEGIDCEGDCTEAYNEGVGVTLTANPATGSDFSGWSGACTNSSGTCDVTMAQAKSVTATFTQRTHLLTADTDGTGSGSVSSSPAGIACGVDCTEVYNEGVVVTLTANPATGSDFSGWSGACTNSSGTCDVTMAAAKSVTATFTQTHLLTADTDGTGSGSVSSSPAGITCGVDCTQIYDEGTVVTLTASPAAGSDFSGWSGACTNSNAICEVTMAEAKSVTATFTQRTHLLTVDTDGTGSGTVTSAPAGINCGVDCNQAYDEGAVVTLTAVPNAGNAFTGWTGACTNSSGTCDVTMAQAKSVTATFTPITVHSRTVSLGLTRHLTAKGTVLSGGFGPCVQNVTIKIQKQKSSRKWQTIKTVSTNQFANYQVRIPDKAGKYRAIAPRIVPNSTNTCAASKSPAKGHKH